ncbi:hypothetical protein ACFSO7_00970 [Bacillus sp. CGMCC 1.16607]
MSEFICCDCCGELSSFDDTAYINDNPICPTCYDRLGSLLQPLEEKG